MKDQVKKNYQIVKKHINSMVSKTLKKPAPPLRYPFIDPGSIYNGNLWDWDSFWALLGLKELNKHALPAKWPEYGKGNVLNFLDHQLEDGYIPMVIGTNRNEKIPYLNRQHLCGKKMNMHKPFLCQQTLLVMEILREKSWIVPYLEKLHLYFACYDNNYFHKNTGLYVWADDIMIGMDNDPASFGRTPGTTANIFLNTFMVKELQSISEICRKLKQNEMGKYYSKKAGSLISAIQNECWDRRDRFFYSVDIDIKTRYFDWFHKGLGVFWKSLPIRIQVWSGFLPLWAGFATKEQAEHMRRHYLDEKSFNSPGGVRTLSKEEKMYDLRETNNPSNWLGPVWIVASYCVFRGLLNYGFVNEAEDLAFKTLKLLADDIKETGTLHEYYNPETCRPVMNSGFINWNILALNMYKELGDFSLSSQKTIVK
ncbi:MAG: trehalase family glycosidase [Chitinispirillia bacterium]